MVRRQDAGAGARSGAALHVRTPGSAVQRRGPGLDRGAAQIPVSHLNAPAQCVHQPSHSMRRLCMRLTLPCLLACSRRPSHVLLTGTCHAPLLHA